MPQVPTREEIANMDDPRKRFIAAGARVLVDDGFEVLQSGISPDRVAKVAGRSRRTFYDHFASKAEFVREVLASCLDASEHEVIKSTTASLVNDVIEAHEGDLVESVARISDLNFAGVMASEATIVQVIAFAMAGNDTETRDEIGRHFQEIDETFEEVFDQIVSRWGRKLRDPWSTKRYATLLRMLGDGLYLRKLLDPAAVPEDLFSMLAITLLPVATYPAEQPDESLRGHLNAISDEAALIWREQVDPGKVTDARQRVMAAIDRILPSSRGDTIDLELVAAESGVSKRTISSVFGSIQELIAEALVSRIPDWDADVALDLSDSAITTEQALSRQTSRMAAWVLQNRPLIETNNRWPGESHWSSDSVTMMKLTGPLLSILQGARERREIRTDFNARRVSTICVHLAFSAGLSRADFDPEFFSEALIDLFYNGISAGK